ncbi:RNA polymerase sigma-70 factor [Mucilaginibacter sp. BJC16-A38]|uniref:RNA polymerase sigma factor n=1 Tax=Mucilaginibacter phenanthrenivorans TaxID=1234842 RepID=UPI002158209B|nr:RNA polymerase sigma-70 factor [Mucilaginibacter phenanthrenivorans]MCR8559575.1 RNA polymerase sigma-70 factor [Mucilaginibacter phenanthrenivorans]
MQVILNEKFERSVLKDELVFKNVYRQYFVKLYRFSFSLVHCRESAEEIVHDVLINLWKKRNDFTGIENLNTYLYVSVKNLSLNYLRDQAKHNHVDIETIYDECNFISIDPESLLITKERAENLNALINNLPVRCKMIFNLIKIDGLKYKEVASLLNISAKTVENQLSIAIKKIAEAVKRS